MVRLRRSDTSRPGLTRVPRGRGFQYLDPAGQRPEPEALQRIRDLVIPPAWKDVWICPWPNGHIQATGRDAAGRRQYLYHPAWRERRDEAKHRHVLEVAEALPEVRETLQRHLATRGLNRDRVLSAAVRLLDLGFFRVGGERYVEENGTYGLATLLRDHAEVKRGSIVFTYQAKGGTERIQAVAEPEVCKVIRQLRARPGDSDRLWAYREGRTWHDVHSDDINTYLKQLTGLDVSAKDFRTWHATVLAAVGLAVSGAAATSPTAQKRAVVRVVKEVSAYLGNTPAVCRASYIDPRVIDRYLNGETIAAALPALGRDTDPGTMATHGAVERAVIDLLRE